MMKTTTFKCQNMSNNCWKPTKTCWNRLANGSRPMSKSRNRMTNCFGYIWLLDPCIFSIIQYSHNKNAVKVPIDGRVPSAELWNKQKLENMKKKVQIFHVIDRQCLSFVAFFFHNSARCCKQQFLFVLDEWMCQTALFLHFNSKTTLAKQQHG